MATPDLHEIPFGYCYCGCGELAPLAPANNAGRGWVKGAPLRYVHGHRCRLPHAGGPRADAVEKFWARTEPTDGPLPTRCWIWQGGLYSNGYAKASISGRTRLGHRLAYELVNDIRLKSPRVVAHHCDTPACLNPHHLFLGTAKRNSLDMTSKGRAHRKLTPGQVLEMRADHGAAWSTAALAEKFGVVSSTVYRVVSGRGWRHLIGDWMPVPTQPNKTKVVCKRGHSFDQTIRSDGTPRRICRTCHLGARDRRRMQKSEAAFQDKAEAGGAAAAAAARRRWCREREAVWRTWPQVPRSYDLPYLATDGGHDA